MEYHSYDVRTEYVSPCRLLPAHILPSYTNMCLRRVVRLVEKRCARWKICVLWTALTSICGREKVAPLSSFHLIASALEIFAHSPVVGEAADPWGDVELVHTSPQLGNMVLCSVPNRPGGPEQGE